MVKTQYGASAVIYSHLQWLRLLADNSHPLFHGGLHAAVSTASETHTIHQS